MTKQQTTLKSDTNTLKPWQNDPLIGAHESIAGGIHLAFGRAESIGCRTLQIFTKNASQWRAKPLTEDDIASYKTAASESSIRHIMAHDSYLINMCAKDKGVLLRSREAFVEELQRCEMLGIPHLNFHPGAHMGCGEEDGIKCMIESLDWAHEQTKGFRVKSVIETTAGQGSCLGHRFEHLRAMIEGIAEPERVAVCIDTCHVFAAGYDLSTEQGYYATFEEFAAVIGFDRLVGIHINDSKKGLGSRVDRHEHIGKGMIGKLGFQLLLQDERLAEIPKFLETPKGDDLKEDKMNLKVLRALAKKPLKEAKRVT